MTRARRKGGRAKRAVVKRPSQHFLSRRELIAITALQALVKKSPVSIVPSGEEEIYIQLARGAVSYADALISELDGKAVKP